MATPIVTCRVCGRPVVDFYLVADERAKGIANASGTVITDVPGPAGLCREHRTSEATATATADTTTDTKIKKKDKKSK